MVIVDCHAHLSDICFKENFPDLLENLRKQELFVIAVGMSYSDFQEVIDISLPNPDHIGFGLGLHPIQRASLEETRPLTSDDTVLLSSWLDSYSSSAICLGECGLDFSKWLCPTSLERDLQRDALRLQIELSKKYDLPLNLHSRSAGKPLLDLLKQNDIRGALLHAFDGGKKAIRQGVEDGHYFSIAPSLVRDPSQQQVAKSVPLDRIVLESDAPALGPVKGRNNTPLNLLQTVDHLSNLLELSNDEVIQLTTQNAVRLFPKLKNHIRL